MLKKEVRKFYGTLNNSKEMLRIAKISKCLGDKHTIITGDQATYELARTIRDKYPQEFGHGVLSLGGCDYAQQVRQEKCLGKRLITIRH